MTTRYRSEVRTDARARQAAMAEDVREGLTARPRRLPPKYFYDAEGSRLFDAITRLPEYYLTRAEEALLAEVGPGLMRELEPRDVVELGSGFSTKTRRLLAVRAPGSPLRYTPVDVDGTAVTEAAGLLLADDARLEVHAVIGDFERHLGHVPPPPGRRLVLFLGSTIGNLDAPARLALLRQVRRLLRPGDGFLLGVDLVKDTAVLEAAYNDTAGVTAAFNRNILRVVNQGLGADFEPDAYRHHAWYNSAESRIEMHLVPESPQRVTVPGLGLTLRLDPSETIWTESSYKFTRVSTRSMLSAAGLRLEAWHTDREQRFALALAMPARPAASATRAA
jgi:L-histidine N-alpha-methyltransferase